MTTRGPEPSDAPVAGQRLFRPEVLDGHRERTRNHDIAKTLPWTWIVILIVLASIEMLAFVALLSRRDIGRDMTIIGRHGSGTIAPR